MIDFLKENKLKVKIKKNNYAIDHIMLNTSCLISIVLKSGDAFFMLFLIDYKPVMGL